MATPQEVRSQLETILRSIAARGNKPAQQLAADGLKLTPLITTFVERALASLTISPANPGTLSIAGTKQFSVSGTWTDGTTGAPVVTWTASGGTITATGLFTAGTTAGAFTVTATGGGKTATATGTISAPTTTPTLTNLAITPTTATVDVNQGRQFTAKATWSDGSTSNLTGVWSASAGSIGAEGWWSGVGVAGTVTITAAAQGKSASAVVTVTAAVPPPSTTPTIPTNHTLMVEKALDSKSIGWPVSSKWGDSTYLNVVSDADVPGGKCLEWVFPAGFTDVTSPANTGTRFTTKSEVYLEIGLKVSKPWQYHTTGVNKLLFIGTQAGAPDNELVITLKGSSESSAQICLGLQNPAQSGPNVSGGYFTANVAQPGFSLGVRHVIKVLATQNTAGQANGILKWWVDDVLVGHHTNVVFNAMFDAVTLNPNWGGQGSPPKAQRDWIRMDHLVMSGKTDSTSTPPPAPTLESLSITPITPTVTVNTPQQFTASARWSDGSTTLPALSWAASTGTINSSGSWSGSTTAGTATITVSGGGKTATATVTVTEIITAPTGSILFDDRFVNGIRASAANGVSWGHMSAGSQDAVFMEPGALCLKFGGNTSLADDAWAEPNFQLPELNQVFIGLDLEFDANYFHRDGDGADNNKLLRLFGGAPGSTRDQAYTAPHIHFGGSTMPVSGFTGPSTVMPEFKTANGTSNYSTGNTGTSFQKSTSTKFGFFGKIGTKLLTTMLPRWDGTPSTTQVAGDGVIKIWINRVLKYNRTDLPIYSPDGHKMQYGYLWGWANSGFTTTTIVRIRRFVVATEPLPDYLP